ncbi:hypothetical protein Adt_42162 [Abeliophyllum distichum]|uniref:Uncharacterized protein n=1 Tax=Abeliophyllum distichum TaxID=126358 RepID=A0ABD1PQW4_9LAMI
MPKYNFSKISNFNIDEVEDDDENMSPSLQSSETDTGPISLVIASLSLDLAMGASSSFLSREPLLLLESVDGKAKKRHKELTEALAEFSKANESLARLEAHTCADSEEATGL